MITLEDIMNLKRLNAAYNECLKNVGWTQEIIRYGMSLSANNLNLIDDVISGRYTQSPTRDQVKRERGKQRCIEAPALRDRIIQKIINQDVLIPALSRYMVYENGACLQGKGVAFSRRIHCINLHKASETCEDPYVLTTDIKGYFASIDKKILKEMVKNPVLRIADSTVLMLVNYIIDMSKAKGEDLISLKEYSEDPEKICPPGLSLGSECPQTLAMFNLTPVDTYCQNVVGTKMYVRHMDDICIHGGKDKLKTILPGIEKEAKKLNLSLNLKKTQIIRCSHGYTWLQTHYQIQNGRIIKTPTTGKITRMRKKMKSMKRAVDAGYITEKQAHDIYRSSRMSLMKDYNACFNTVGRLDRLYEKFYSKPYTRKDNKNGKRTRSDYLGNIYAAAELGITGQMLAGSVIGGYIRYRGLEDYQVL